MVEKFKELCEGFVILHEKIGFKRLVQYITIGFFIVVIFNFKSILRDAVEVFNEISEDIHSEKMELRSQLLGELKPKLIEFRTEAKADRILYLEYHNSKENLVGIPFKYIELVLQDFRHGVAPVNEEKYKSINAGMITDIYEDIKFGNIIQCNGPEDSIFSTRYPGIYEFVNSRDASKKQIFISVPGINQPVGMIILEWISENNKSVSLQEIEKMSTSNYIPRINALILSKRISGL